MAAGKNRNSKKTGNESTVCAKPCTPSVLATEKIRTRAIAMTATIAHANRPMQHDFVALFIGIDFTVTTFAG